MELRSDDLQPVAQLANALNDVLEESHWRTEALYETLGRIGALSKIPIAKQRLDQHGGCLNRDEDESTRLHRENMELMVEIQRQEYIGKKWDTILKQNTDLLDSMVSWLQENSDSESLSELRQKIQFLQNSSERSRELLLKKAEVAQQDAERMLEIVQALQSLLDKDISTFYK